MEKWKRDFVLLLQSSITVPTGDIMDGMEVKLYGGNIVSVVTFMQEIIHYHINRSTM